MNEREYAVVTAMAHHGGGFVKALAAAFRHADHKNFNRLKAAFPDYWRIYEQPHFSGLRTPEETAR